MNLKQDMENQLIQPNLLNVSSPPHHHHHNHHLFSNLRPRSFKTMVSVLFDRGEGGGAGNYKYKCQKFINAKTGRKNQIWFRTCSFSFIYNCHTESRVSHSLFPLRRGTLSGMWGVPCDL